MAGEKLGMSPEQLDTLRWAALIHDVGKLAAPSELIRKDGQLSPAERGRYLRRVQIVQGLLAEVDFLRPAVGHVAAGEPQTTIGRVIAAADAFDAMTSTRSHRQARTQEEAFAALEADEERYGADVVEALAEAILESGIRYGTPTADAADEVERLVRDRTRRA
jgi:HD-GYP domain-containing protein (c-di-GMP phosphodiesterase class II)